MTREEIMENRILDSRTVRLLRDIWAGRHVHTELNPEDAYAEMYISDEKIQRLPPEEITDMMLDDRHQGTPGGALETTDSIFKILAVATGRPEGELREAVFGTGAFDPGKFYEPTPLQKEAIRVLYAVYTAVGNADGTDLEDMGTWPPSLAGKWRRIVAQVPDDGMSEFVGECRERLRGYIDGGIPYWLDKGQDD